VVASIACLVRSGHPGLSRRSCSPGGLVAL